MDAGGYRHNAGAIRRIILRSEALREEKIQADGSLALYPARIIRTRGVVSFDSGGAVDEKLVSVY